MRDDLFCWLQNWYLSRCNGEWEHEYGVKIDTLDNPGWHITIDLVDTKLEGKNYSAELIERSENNWIRCKIEGKKFDGCGGPANLSEIILVFKKLWISK